MKANIDYVSRINGCKEKATRTVEINTLQDLIDLIKTEQQGLIIDILYLPQNGEELEIMVYDDFIE